MPCSALGTPAPVNQVAPSLTSSPTMTHKFLAALPSDKATISSPFSLIVIEAMPMPSFPAVPCSPCSPCSPFSPTTLPTLSEVMLSVNVMINSPSSLIDAFWMPTPCAPCSPCSPFSPTTLPALTVVSLVSEITSSPPNPTSVEH